MSAAVRSVGFIDEAQEIGGGAFQEQHVQATKASCPTDRAIAARAAELRGEKDRLRQSADHVENLFALGEAAKLRGEVEEYMFESDERVNAGRRFRHQDVNDRVAHQEMDRLQTFDADDVEYYELEKHTLPPANMYMNEICEEIGIFDAARAQASEKDEPVTDAKVPQGEEDQDTHASSSGCASSRGSALPPVAQSRTSEHVPSKPTRVRRRPAPPPRARTSDQMEMNVEEGNRI
eukprot:TRINITY_DN63247_c0_g1_i1.p1 TRINITY_DN63247_c0_g1~~TRINITY_DN63247_c0_g1_i1.p1  ORF type:complete len:235 (+),score=54.58 TRINITY_DN63247_c0_g1_i1:142-846(+)